MNGAPKIEELISLQHVVENVALFSEVSDQEVNGRCSPNLRGVNGSFERALNFMTIRNLLMEKVAVIRLLDAFNATLNNKPSFYLLYDGHAIEDKSIGKDLNYYLLHLKLTRYVEPPKGVGRWGTMPPPQGMTGKFDFEKISALHFRRDQIRMLLDECCIKHSIGASSTSPSSSEDVEVVVKEDQVSEPTSNAQNAESEVVTKSVEKRKRGKVAALEKEYLEAQRRANNKFDPSEIYAHLFKMALEDGAWVKLVVDKDTLYQIDLNKRQRFNKKALQSWLARRRTKLNTV